MEMQYPNGWVEYYTYDVMGRLLAVDDTHPSEKPAKTQKHTYQYDANGNLLYEYMRGNGTGQAKNETLYTYDALNRLTTAHDNYGNSTRVYTYDSLGNLTLETGLGSHECDYIYNNLNQQVDRSSDSWKSHTVSEYDNRGNLVYEAYGKNKKLTRAGEYVYDETNKMVRGINGNGEESIYTYNGLGALMENTWVIAKNGYGYHDVDAGDLAPDLPDIPGNNGNNGNGNSGNNSNNGNNGNNGNHFGNENGDNGNHFGNADETDAGLEVLADPNEGIMLLGNSGNGNNGNNGNGNGNQDKPTGSDVKKTSTVVKQFVVDFTGETYKPLMEHEVNGLDYRYVYSDRARLSVVVQGIEHGSAAVLDERGDLHAYYHTDYLGTTDYLTSAVDSRVIAWTSYDEWGEINHNAVLKCGQRELDLVKEYATHDFDAVLNMYYAKARFYDADNRHFASMDPILEPSQYDLRSYVTDPMQLVQYLYVKNNAVNWIDPKGLVTNERLNQIARDVALRDLTDTSNAIKQMQFQKYALEILSTSGIYTGLHKLAQVILYASMWESHDFVQSSMQLEYKLYKDDGSGYVFADAVGVRNGSSILEIYEVKPYWHLSAPDEFDDATDQLGYYVELACKQRNGVIGKYSAKVGHLVNLLGPVVFYENSNVIYRMGLTYKSGIIGYQVERKQKKKDDSHANRAQQKYVKLGNSQAEKELKEIINLYRAGLETDTTKILAKEFGEEVLWVGYISVASYAAGTAMVGGVAIDSATTIYTIKNDVVSKAVASKAAESIIDSASETIVENLPKAAGWLLVAKLANGEIKLVQPMFEEG